MWTSIKLYCMSPQGNYSHFWKFSEITAEWRVIRLWASSWIISLCGLFYCLNVSVHRTKASTEGGDSQHTWLYSMEQVHIVHTAGICINVWHFNLCNFHQILLYYFYFLFMLPGSKKNIVNISCTRASAVFVKAKYKMAAMWIWSIGHSVSQ